MTRRAPSSTWPDPVIVDGVRWHTEAIVSVTTTSTESLPDRSTVMVCVPLSASPGSDTKVPMNAAHGSGVGVGVGVGLGDAVGDGCGPIKLGRLTYRPNAN